MMWDGASKRDFVVAGTLLLCIALAAVVRAVRRPAPEEETAVAAENRTNLDGDIQVVVETGDRPLRKSGRQVVFDAIAQHKEKIAEDPSNEEVPAYQLAIANLYIAKLGDYEAASVQLEEMIEQFPESNMTAQAYVKLGNCYENLGWRGVADNTYKKMERHFPEGSENWEYARAKQRRVDNVY
jgi:TolA-binding protein